MSNVDYLAMSDEDWLNASIPTSSNEGATTTAPEVVTTEETSTTVPDSVTTDPVTTAEEPGTTETSGVGETNTATETISTDTQTETPGQTQQEQTDAAIQAEIDYKAAYERLTTPFKANGREIQVKDVDDAIQLMQMGANYTKKMAALKPNLKLMKLLESNGLMDEEKISYLIDLQAKNPAAISRLVKDSGIDPMDLDEDKAKDYRPTARQVDDRELELDQVIEEIQDSPAYTKTVTVVSKEWDDQSKQAIAQAPQLLKIINSHVESGVYDVIKKEVETERMYGRLTGISDIEAYRQTGDRLQAKGGFNHLGRQETTEAPRIAPPSTKPSPVEDQKTKDRKRAASATTSAAPVTAKPEFNPLALSDEEFSKIANKKFL